MPTRSEITPRQRTGRILVSLFTALVLHVVLGWPWSVGGGILAGWLFPRGAWWRGAVVVGMDWALLIGYNLFVAYGPVREMHRVVADIAWSSPSWTIPLASVLVGAAIGVGGGLVGSSLYHIMAARRKT